jgi:hypothetical protein
MSVGHSPQAALDQVRQATGDVARFYFAGSVAPLRQKPPHDLLLALALFSKRPQHEAVVEVAGLAGDPITAEDGLHQLQRRSLITQRDGRYSMLPLTRKYALAELAARPDFEREARERQLQWYLAFTAKYGGPDWMDWHIHYDKVEAEWENLLALFDWCATEERYNEMRIFWQRWYEHEQSEDEGSVLGISNIYGFWRDRLVWVDWLIRAAERRNDWRTAVGSMRDKAFTLMLMARPDQLDEADALLMRAWDLREHTILSVHSQLAQNIVILCIRQQRYGEAREWCERSSSFHMRNRP